MFGRVTSVLAFLFIRATGKQTYFIFKTTRMALFKFIIFRLNFRYILPCLTVPNYAFCLNNAVQVEEFQLWFAQTDTVKAPYCNGGFCNNKHLHFQNILSKCHYCEFIVLAILGLRTNEKEMPNQKRN